MVRILLIALAGILTELAAQQPAPASSPGPEPVPLTQIALRGDELSRVLRDLAGQVPAASEIAAFENQLAEQEDAVRTLLEESEGLLARSATVMEIRERSREWRAYSQPEARQRKTLAAWGAACEQSLAALKKHQAIWQATLNSTKDVPEVESVRARVRQSLRDIETVNAAAEEHLRTVVKLQDRVSKRSAAIAAMLDRLAEEAKKFQARLFRPDTVPIWRAGAPGRDSFTASFRRAVGRSLSNSAAFVLLREGLVAQLILCLAFAFAVVRWLGRAEQQGQAPDASAVEVTRLLARPAAVTVLMTAPILLASLPAARMSVVLLLIQIYLFPIARLLPSIAGCSRRVAVLAAAFYALHALASILDTQASAGRELAAAVFTASLATLAWWVRQKPGGRTPRELLAARSAFAVLTLILVANLFGFLLLSNLLRVCAVLSSYIALVVYTFARVAAILLAGALRLPPLDSLATVRLHEPDVLRWMKRAVAVLAVAWWIYAMLDLLALKSEAGSLIASTLALRLGIKSVSISLGELLAAVCVLAGGSLTARAIRFVLREEILARLPLSRGVPEMISISCYYVLLLLVFVMSVAAAGVQLDKLTFLTGALGVGIGFGLQSLVNNFVSGLVLQFERPIRIGDVLEVGAISGEVRRIGIRSSMVRTFQGAEVIIPNSALVSNQVVNWTLTEPLRRVELQVPVAYGTAPERVLELLSDIARGHPEVLRDPAPGAFFLGFGPGAMDFVLMFWAQQNTHFRLRSEIAIAVNTALGRAGIEIPLPQHEVRLRSVDAAALDRKTRSARAL